MINILFVDDDPNILSGLQRMLRSMRREWQMYFASSANEALEVFDKTGIDVIVSDMKMPGIDGAALLQEVRTRYPHTVRLILSGYSEKEMIMKSVGAAHQYISKPCDSEMLKEKIQRACNLRDLLGNENLRRLVSQMHSVPSLPTLYSEMMAELNLPEPNMRKIGEIVKKDIGMTVKVLQIVNSAFFGLQRNVSDAGDAINFLGLDTIKSLTLSIGIFSQFENQKQSQKTISEIWNHSMSVGVLAKKIAASENPEDANDAFTAGLLHEIGEIVLAVNLPEQFAAMQQLIEKENMTRIAAERQIFETTHSEVGAYLLGLWGLPHQVVEAVAFHHFPGKFQTGSFSPMTAVHIADEFHAHSGEEILTEPENCFDVKYLEKLGLMEKIPVWYQEYLAKS